MAINHIKSIMHIVSSLSLYSLPFHSTLLCCCSAPFCYWSTLFCSDIVSGSLGVDSHIQPLLDAIHMLGYAGTMFILVL